MIAGVMKCPDCEGRQTVAGCSCVKCQGKGYIPIITKRVDYSSHRFMRRTYLKPWKDPDSLYCSKKLGEILEKELPVPAKPECTAAKME